MKVFLSHAFEEGTLNDNDFKDLPYFDDSLVEMLLDFIECVEQDQPLKGKNKTSWQDNQQQIIPNTERYQEQNCWHYHCGEYQQDEPKVYTINLNWNIDGLKSAAVIHYQKIKGEAIFILGYSSQHIPFPKPNETNPLFDRTNGKNQ